MLLAFVAIFVSFVAWTYITSRLATASRPSLNRVENVIREDLIARNILTPKWKHYRPPHWDLLQHFVFYFPFGMLAGAAAATATLWLGARWKGPTLALGVTAAFGIALIDEFAQIGSLDRQASLDDLLSAWLGAACGLLIFLSLQTATRAARKRAPSSRSS